MHAKSRKTTHPQRGAPFTLHPPIIIQIDDMKTFAGQSQHSASCANHPTSCRRLTGKHEVHQSSNSPLHLEKCSTEPTLCSVVKIIQPRVRYSLESIEKCSNGIIAQFMICLNSSSNRLPYFVFFKRGEASSKNDRAWSRWSPGSRTRDLATWQPN